MLPASGGEARPVSVGRGQGSCPIEGGQRLVSEGRGARPVFEDDEDGIE